MLLQLVVVLGTTGLLTADDYSYSIPWDNTVEDYPGLVYPKSGQEIDLMDVSRMQEPNQIRLSLTGDVTEMAIMWTTNSVTRKECVRYGIRPDDMMFTAMSTYHQFDWNYKKELGDFYYTSGFIHEALMINLVPGKRHYYQIESNGKKSEILSFVAAPNPDSPISLLHLGDQGIFGTSVMVTKTMVDRAAVKDFHGAVHCGDIAYADKYMGVRPPASGRSEQAVWDTWGQMIEPLASQVPYMVTPGNHEMVGIESGWENGTIYNKRFIMPENERHYSFGLGMVYIIAVNTDDHIDARSTQGVWFENTLKDIDREVYPWVVVFQHRPIYNSNTNHGNWTGKSTYVYDSHPDAELPAFDGWEEHYEDLLVEYGVDFVLTGHVHHYERTWPVRKVNRGGKRVTEVMKSYENVKYPIHITCGHAGMSLYTKTWSDYEDENGYRPPVYQDDWDFSAYKSNAVWGHCEMEFLDRFTAKHYMFPMRHSDAAEEVTITKEGRSEGGCEYTDSDGNSRVALPGESFKMDCNTCVCGDNGQAGCTLMLCPDHHEDTNTGCEYTDENFITRRIKFGEFFMGGGDRYCVCGVEGQVACMQKGGDNPTQSTDTGCPYVDGKGNTQVADEGEQFIDGCNTCWCGPRGTPLCPNKMLTCPNMCDFLNRDYTYGWTRKGKVTAWDKNDDCFKECKCKVKARGKTRGQGKLDCADASCVDVEPQMNNYCEYNLMVLGEGDVAYEGCNKCTCRSDGSMKCTNEDCCLYIDNGETARAKPGESFNNGCNQCQCLAGGRGACTRRGCPSKCSYKNWDLVPGYASIGEEIAVFDEGEDYCPKYCSCQRGPRGAQVVCEVDECIYY